MLIGCHTFLSEKNPFHVVMGRVKFRDGIKVLSLPVSCIWFLPALMILSDWISLHGSQFDTARSILMLYLKSNKLGIRCIFLSKRALEDSQFCFSLAKGGSHVCPWRDHCSYLMVMQVNCWVKINFTQRKPRLFSPATRK